MTWNRSSMLWQYHAANALQRGLQQAIPPLLRVLLLLRPCAPPLGLLWLRPRWPPRLRLLSLLRCAVLLRRVLLASLLLWNAAEEVLQGDPACSMQAPIASLCGGQDEAALPRQNTG